MSHIDVPGVLTYARNNVSVRRIGRVFGIPQQQVLAILAASGIAPATPRPKLRTPPEGKRRSAREPADTPPPPKDSPAAVAKRVWGSRLTERDGDYWLDGRRIGFTDLMRRTNVTLTAWGMEPVTGDPGWAPPP